jgi:dolichol-phosphate mannosyltransferase
MPRNENDSDRLVSVIVPAYREGAYIGRTLTGIVECFRRSRINLELVAVVDYEKGDSTLHEIREVARRYKELVLIKREGRRGVGTAVRDGIKRSRGDYVIIVMGDQSENPRDVIRVARVAEKCDIVFTNRFRHGKPDQYPAVKYVANRLCNIMAMVLFGIEFSDITNAFKAYRRTVLDRVNLHSNGFEVFLEAPVAAIMVSRRAREVDVGHVVRKGKLPKLSVARDGPRYVRTMISLLRQRRTAGINWERERYPAADRSSLKPPHRTGHRSP